MIYGYARVSTNGQDLESQIEALKNEGCKEENIYSEHFSGKTTNRPQLKIVLDKLAAGDKFIVTKLDRLARNTKEGIETIEELFKKDVKVHVLNVGLMENTTIGNFFLQTLLAVAEMERNLILDRTREGKAMARSNPNFKEGRPIKYKKFQLDMAMDLLKVMSYNQVEKEMAKRGTPISRSSIYREAKKRDLVNTKD